MTTNRKEIYKHVTPKFKEKLDAFCEKHSMEVIESIKISGEIHFYFDDHGLYSQQEIEEDLKN